MSEIFPGLYDIEHRMFTHPKNDLNFRTVESDDSKHYFTCDYSPIIVGRCYPHKKEKLYGTFLLPESADGIFPEYVLLEFFEDLTEIVGDVTECLMLFECKFNPILTIDISGKTFINNRITLISSYGFSIFYTLQQIYDYAVHSTDNESTIFSELRDGFNRSACDTEFTIYEVLLQLCSYLPRDNEFELHRIIKYSNAHKYLRYTNDAEFTIFSALQNMYDQLIHGWAPYTKKMLGEFMHNQNTKMSLLIDCPEEQSISFIGIDVVFYD